MLPNFSFTLSTTPGCGLCSLLFNSSLPEQNGRHFTDDIFKRIFLNEKSKFRFKFYWNLFLRVQYVSVGSSNGLAPNRRQAVIWTNADPVHQRINAALGGDELRFPCNEKAVWQNCALKLDFELSILWTTRGVECHGLVTGLSCVFTAFWFLNGILPRISVVRVASCCRIDYYRDYLCMRPTNERRRYYVTSSLIGWARTQADPLINTPNSARFRKISSEILMVHRRLCE